ncbi:MAG TPA: hypothetical protein VFX61_11500 [Micromonosporaceae bacterium]|nr:hypothetical protein [Micromonosporaceae bacterium]
MVDDGWLWADAWVFVALVIAGGAGRHRRAPSSRRPEGVRLADVLTTADHLKDDIPDRDELETAVRRLTGAGLITVTDGWFRVTPTGEQLWRTRPHRGLTTAVDTIHGALNRRHPPGQGDWSLDAQEHAIAVQEFIARRRPPMPRRSPEGGP